MKTNQSFSPSRIARVLLGFCLAASLAAAQITYSGGGGAGTDWRSGLNWTDDPTWGDVYVSFDNNPLDLLPGPALTFVVPAGSDTIAVTGTNLNAGSQGATINVTDSVTRWQGNKQANNMTVNLEGTSTFLIEPQFKLGGGMLVNYNSSATSDSSYAFALTNDGRFQMWQAGATLNVNNGELKFNTVNFNADGAPINLNGGDLTFRTISYLAGVTGVINFDSTAGSIVTIPTALDATAADSWFALGTFRIDGVVASKSNFNVTWANGVGMTIAVPEPSTFALIGGFIALALVLNRRRTLG